MNEPLKVDGIIEDVNMKPCPTDQNPEGMRYAFKIKGRNYATFDTKIGGEFSKYKNKKVSVEYYDKTSADGKTTYHNILKMTLSADFESGHEVHNEETEGFDEQDEEGRVWYVKERRKYRGMAVSYAKDLVIADKLKEEELMDIAEKMFVYIMEE